MSIQTTEQKKEEYLGFMFELSLGQIKPGKCLVPCRDIKYAVHESGFTATDPQFVSFGISFENVVEKTVSELQINTRTLVTRFGGIIGVGKNLMWFIILVFSAVGFCANKTQKKDDQDEQKGAHDMSRV